MSSILDIEGTIEAGNQYMMENWYWNEFLPKIDEDNIRNDYCLVYQEFSEHEWMSFPYNYPEHAWEWLLENKIMVLSRYDDSDLYGWYEKYEDQPKIHRNVNDFYKYRLTDKFFEDYQRSVVKRRSAEDTKLFEEWIYRADYTGQRGYDSLWYHYNMKNYEWPIMYNQPI